MYEFTSESVSNGHPDKIADLISDTVATFPEMHQFWQQCEEAEALL